MSGLSAPRSVRVLTLVAPLLAVLATGCGSETGEYPADLRYPLRTDLLVETPPSDQTFYPDPPGHLDESIAQAARKEGAKAFDPAKIPAKQRNELRRALLERFGTPRRPRIAFEDEALKKTFADLDLTRDTLRTGSQLYRRHCLHCHGLSGDGRGPTGPWVHPHPRDYREGLFKFISTTNDEAKAPGRKPRRVDLRRTLMNGIDGTSMPSFALLGETEIDQINQIISYVIHLSLRGEVEYATMRVLIQDGPEGLRSSNPVNDATLSIDEYVEDWGGEFLKRWAAADANPNQPAPYPYKGDDKAELKQSIARGYKIFTNPEGAASCIGCHRDFGRQVNFRYDKWGTTVRPANLTVATYRGGRRPVDIYWRITGGIEPSGMPAGKALSPNEVWDVVNFVHHLPYPAMLPDEVRDKVYPPEKSAKESTHASAR